MKQRQRQKRKSNRTTRDLVEIKRKYTGNLKDDKTANKEQKTMKPSWLIQTLLKINKSYSSHTVQSKFHFKNDYEAATKNTEILRGVRWDVHAAVKNDGASVIHPGSEFRNIQHISK